MPKSMAGPCKHRSLDFIPLGGFRECDLENYLKSDIVLAVGGSWICTPDLVNGGQWDEIVSRARDAADTARRAEGEE